MNAQDSIVIFTSVFIIGMVWLRTRMQYVRRGAGPLQMTRAGRIYLGTVIVLLAIGWVAAPAIGQLLWPTTGATPTLMRVVWCLATYYVFILIHRVLKSRGTAIFRHLDADPAHRQV